MGFESSKYLNTETKAIDSADKSLPPILDISVIPSRLPEDTKFRYSKSDMRFYSIFHSFATDESEYQQSNKSGNE